MKEMKVLKRILAVILTGLIVFSAIPVSFAATEITAWDAQETVDGKKIVNITGETEVKANIPEDYIVIVKDGSLIVPADQEIEVYGTIWLQENGSAVTQKNETQSGKFVIKKGAAFVRGIYPVFGYDVIDLKQSEGFGSEPLTPIALLNDNTQVTLRTNDVDGTEIIVRGTDKDNFAEINLTSDFLLTSKDIIRFGEFVNLNKESKGKFLAYNGAKIYNNSNNEDLINLINATENADVYHQVKYVVFDNDVKGEAQSAYIKKGESFTADAGENKIFVKKVLSGTPDETVSATFSAEINKPESFELYKVDAKYTVNFKASENGKIGVESKDTEGLLSSVSVDYDKEVTFKAEADKGYKCVGIVVEDGGKYTSLVTDIETKGEITTATISGIKSNLNVTAVFAEVFAENVIVSTSSAADSFYPETEHQFTAEVLPENAKVRDVKWSLKDAEGKAVSDTIATIDNKGLLKIGKEATADDAFKVIATSLSKEEIIASYDVKVSLITDKEIADYFTFSYNAEAAGNYNPESWSKSDVKIGLGDFDKENGLSYVFSMTEDGSIPMLADAKAEVVTAEESNANIRLRIFALNADEKVVKVLDFKGVSVKIDKAAPEVVYTPDFDEENWFKDKTINFTVNETNSGIEKVFYTKENRHDATSTDITFDVDGKCTFSVNSDTSENSTFYLWAIDKAGNISAAKSFNLKIDTIAPQSEIKVHSAVIASTLTNITFGLVKLNSKTEIEITAKDKSANNADGSGVATIKYKYVKDGEIAETIAWKEIDCKTEGTPYFTEITKTVAAPTTDGMYSMHILVIDALGNERDLSYVINSEEDGKSGLDVNNVIPDIELKVDGKVVKNDSINYVTTDTAFVIKAKPLIGEKVANISKASVKVSFNGSKDYDLGLKYDEKTGFTVNKASFTAFRTSNPNTDFPGITKKTNTTDLNNGTFVFTFETVNDYGNVSIAKVTVILDKVTPKISVAYLINDDYPEKTYRTERPIVITPTVGCSGIKEIEVTVGGEKTVVEPNDKGEYIYIAHKNASHTFKVTINAGKSASTNFTVKYVDKAVPEIGVKSEYYNSSKTVPYNGEWVALGGSKYIKFTISESQSTKTLGTRSFYYSTDNGETWTLITATTSTSKAFKIEESTVADYIFKIVAANGKESVSGVYQVRVDGKEPIIKNINYVDSVLDDFIDNILFFFYKPSAKKVEVNIEEEETGVAEVVLKGVLKKGAADENDTVIFTANADKIKKDGTKKYIAEFTIPVDTFEGHFLITAKDFAGKTSTLDTRKDKIEDELQGIIVDGDAPIIGTPVFVDETGTETKAEGYHQADAKTVKFDVTEANFYAENVVFEINAVDKDGKAITTFDKKLEKNKGSKNLYKVTEWNEKAETIATQTTSLTFNKEGNYSIIVRATDRSGNEAESREVNFSIDNTKPTVEVSYDKEPYLEDEETGTKYFVEKTKMTLTVKELNFNWDAKEDIKIIATDINGKDLEIPVLGEWKNVSDVTYEADVELPDGIYDITVQTTDKAGLESELLEEKVVVDTAAPEITSFTYPNEIIRVVIDNLTLGVFFKDTIQVKVEMEEQTSGIKEVVLTCIPEDGSDEFAYTKTYEKKVGQADGNSSYVAEFSIPAQFKGTLKVKITDYLGRTDEMTNTKLATDLQGNNKEVLVGDNIKPVIENLGETSEIENGAYYTGNKTVVVKVDEANFFGEDVKLKIVAKDDNNNDISAPVKNLKKDIEDVSGLVYTSDNWKTDNDGKHYTELNFTKDGDYTVEVTYTDKSGNVAEAKSISFTIDNTAPVIELVGYNKAPALDSKKTDKKYFSEAVTATIRIIEHNFNWNAETDLVIKATDIKGNTVELPVLSAWTTKEDGNTHEAELLIEKDAIYEIDVQTTDKAGNKKELETENVVVDSIGAEIVEFNLTNSVGKAFINALSFGVFFKNTAEVEIKVTDVTAGVKAIKLKGILEENASTVNKAFEKEITFDEVTTLRDSNGTYSAEFSIPAQFRGTLLVEVYDYSGNYTYAINSQFSEDIKEGETEVVVVDNIAPVITDLEANSDIVSGGYYNTSKILNLEINEANFFAEDVLIKIESADDLNNVVTELDSALVKKEGSANIYVISEWQMTDRDTYSKSIEFTADGEYTVTVSYTDRSQNVAKEKKINFTIDKTNPVIDIKYDKEPVYVSTETDKSYYKEAVIATVTVTEHNFNAKSDDIKIVAKDILGNKVNNPDVSKWSEVAANTHVATIRFFDDANYTLDVETTDLAGNKAVYETQNLVVDTTAPEITGITFSEDSDDIDSFESTSYNSYKYFSNGTSKVTISARDNTSGVQKLAFYGVDYTANAAGEKKEFTPSQVTYAELQNTVSYSFDLPANFKGYIYAQATDYSTNTSTADTEDGFTQSVGAVIEDVDKHEETLDIKIIANEEPNENGFYNEDLPVTLIVDDKYSGINNLTYKIGSADEVEVDFTGENDVVYNWKNDVTVNAVKNNNNNVEVIVSYVDNAGNPHLARRTFKVNYKIDVTAPEITVTYNNNNGVNGGFYKADRVANIVIEELNFSASDVIIKITKDGEAYTSITPSAKSWKHNNTTHTVKVAFSEDGDYTFYIEYTDLAGNKNKGVAYGNSATPNKFTIDKTRPVIQSVVFDNNAAVNGMYYNKARTATITIREHNFVPGKSAIKIAATNKGAAVATPAPSAWKRVGEDLYSATVRFSADAVYKMSISSVDNANNSAVVVNESAFCIDNIDPEVTVTGVVPNSANKTIVKPIVKVNDTNIDNSSISITIKGSKCGKVDEIKEDDVYTVTVVAADLAGRTNKYITTFDTNGKAVRIENNTFDFSVNQFGSTYQVSEKVNAFNGKVMTEPENIEIKEINPDKLKSYKIVVYKDGTETRELAEGKDYTVKVAGGNGEWYVYTYTIFSKNFEEEGFYSIDISSVDMAGNIAQNTLDTKNQDLEFGIDATKPKINITNLNSGDIKEVEKYKVVVNVTDLSLSKVSVFLDGKEIVPEVDGYDYSFVINGSTSLSESQHNIKVVAVDSAGNKEEASVDEFTVTTSKFVALISNNTFVIVTSVTVAALVAAVIILVILKRKKRNEIQEQF